MSLHVSWARQPIVLTQLILGPSLKKMLLQFSRRMFYPSSTRTKKKVFLFLLYSKQNNGTLHYMCKDDCIFGFTYNTGFKGENWC